MTAKNHTVEKLTRLIEEHNKELERVTSAYESAPTPEEARALDEEALGIMQRTTALTKLLRLTIAGPADGRENHKAPADTANINEGFTKKPRANARTPKPTTRTDLVHALINGSELRAGTATMCKAFCGQEFEAVDAEKPHIGRVRFDSKRGQFIKHKMCPACEALKKLDAEVSESMAPQSQGETSC